MWKWANARNVSTRFWAKPVKAKEGQPNRTNRLFSRQNRYSTDLTKHWHLFDAQQCFCGHISQKWDLLSNWYPGMPRFTKTRFTKAVFHKTRFTKAVFHKNSFHKNSFHKNSFHKSCVSQKINMTWHDMIWYNMTLYDMTWHFICHMSYVICHLSYVICRVRQWTDLQGVQWGSKLRGV